MSDWPPTIPAPHVEVLCQPGQRGLTCAYLTMHPHRGMVCAKAMPVVAAQIDERLAAGTMSATGDNCEGWFGE